MLQRAPDHGGPVLRTRVPGEGAAKGPIKVLRRKLVKDKAVGAALDQIFRRAGNHSTGQPADAAQPHKAFARIANTLAVVLAEIRDGLEVRCHTARHPH